MIEKLKQYDTPMNATIITREKGLKRQKGNGKLKLANGHKIMQTNAVMEVVPLAKKPGFKAKRTGFRTFLAVAPDKENLSVILECIYTAYLIKKRHQNFRTVFLGNPENESLIRNSGVFDEIVALQDEDKLRTSIMSVAPDVLYCPGADWRSKLATLFTGSRLKIGGSRLRLVGRLLNFYANDDADSLKRLKNKGLDLAPEFISLPFRTDFATTSIDLPREDYILLSIFGSLGQARAWPVGHAARFIRLAEQFGKKVVIPIPRVREASTEKDLQFLKKTSPGIHFAEYNSAASLAAGIAGAMLVVAPAGSETVTAVLMSKPVILLHDMGSYKNYAATRGLKIAANTKYIVKGRAKGSKKSKKNSQKKHTVNSALSAGISKSSYYFRAADSLEKHIKPHVDECINDCPACQFNSCMELISPERVFENVKKILLPF